MVLNAEDFRTLAYVTNKPSAPILILVIPISANQSQSQYIHYNPIANIRT